MGKGHIMSFSIGTGASPSAPFDDSPSAPIGYGVQPDVPIGTGALPAYSNLDHPPPYSPRPPSEICDSDVHCDRRRHCSSASSCYTIRHNLHPGGQCHVEKKCANKCFMASILVFLFVGIGILVILALTGAFDNDNNSGSDSSFSTYYFTSTTPSHYNPYDPNK